jgi:hypothetical protein
MTVMENQLPLLVLQKLLHVQDGVCPLSIYSIRFIRSVNMFDIPWNMAKENFRYFYVHKCWRQY